MAIQTRNQKQIEYPSQYITEVLLKDGSRIRLRPIRIADTQGWLDFVSRLSPTTKYLRFHYIPKSFTMEDAIRYCTVDYKDTFAFVAEVLKGDRKEIVAIGRYYRLPSKRSAEIAFAIDDQYQGKGIGTKLMEWLANVARDNGITVFEADVLSENEQMMIVFRDYGFHVTSNLEGGVYHVTFPIARTATVAKKEEEREFSSTISSLRAVLVPKSLAVIGASRRPGNLGNLIFQCVMQNGYTGTAFPVNANGDSVMGVKAYRSVLDIPDDVELGVIVVPAPLVSKVADECGRKGVRSIIVISDGFKERGPEGEARERELREVALGHGMRLVGPNCMGVMNTDPAISMNATFSRVYPPSGDVAFLSQSGAMGLVILEYANSLNMGITTFASVGNRADISPDDLLRYWEQDPATKVILLYMESFGEPRRFARIARRVSARKPIVVVKSGSTPAGSRAASSHTGAMASSDVTADVLFRHAGIIRVNAIEELFDVATLLSNQSLPQGRRLVIVTNGGGPGIIAADAASNQGLSVVDLSPETVAKLKPMIKRDIHIGNPLDVTAGATAEEFEGVLRVLAADEGNDAVLTMFVPPVLIGTEAMEEAVRRVAPVFPRANKPLLACFLGQKGFKAKLGSKGKYVPCYPFPEEAISALAKACNYAEIQRRPRGIIPELRGIKRNAARKLMESILMRTAKRPIWLSPDEISQLLNCYGINFVETVTAKTADEAAKTASRMGFPVVVKLASETITHKTDVGGVVLDLKSEPEVVKAFKDIEDRLTRVGRRGEMEGVTVQHMVKGGIETIVGMTEDPTFGPLVMFGMGGVYAELLKDVAIRLQPLTDIDAREMVSSIKMAKLFEGFRGAPASDTESVADLLLRLSAMIEDLPEIDELDFNPVKVMPQGQGYCVVDARILVK